MSKKYDEYMAETLDRANELYILTNKVIPMDLDSNVDKELDREIRDRAIIELVRKATLEGKELTYGDIRLMIDEDSTEKEYENEKAEQQTKARGI